MSCAIVIDVPGLTLDLAEELDRRADLECVPLRFVAESRTGLARMRVARHPLVALQDLREDPSIASDTADSEFAWPISPEVRRWLTDAVRFLGAVAPEGRFSFHAGWTEHWDPSRTLELTCEEFLAMIAAGSLRSDERYHVRRRL